MGRQVEEAEGGGVQLGDKGTTPGHGGRRRAVWQRREASMNWGAGLADRWGPRYSVEQQGQI
jgi:hypothetical protein